ncbi:hypothetical protein J1N35_028967 [Gossypium stocksii]|uniref:Uncharacterized protein n=1 Tax=Gossypium stocksii TaxID=47602 RepID=A0A9D3UXC8_9ROSI|nr:hypothetical protein J1N35_028967 [Gossypium stocksii]
MVRTMVLMRSKGLRRDCVKFSCILFLLQLCHFKTLFGWSAKPLTCLLEILNEAFPNRNIIPTTYYEAKKKISALNLWYVKIDTCPDDYMLHWGDASKKDNCDVCKSSRWKSSKELDVDEQVDSSCCRPKPAQVLRFPNFVANPHNVSLGLASDGFNSLRTMSTSPSTLPILLIPYNLEPWACMKLSSMILSMKEIKQIPLIKTRLYGRGGVDFSTCLSGITIYFNITWMSYTSKRTYVTMSLAPFLISHMGVKTISRSTMTFKILASENLKILDGYASNISGCINLKEHKLNNLKSHDDHILMQGLCRDLMIPHLRKYMSIDLRCDYSSLRTSVALCIEIAMGILSNTHSYQSIVVQLS